MSTILKTWLYFIKWWAISYWLYNKTPTRTCECHLSLFTLKCCFLPVESGAPSSLFYSGVDMLISLLYGDGENLKKKLAADVDIYPNGGRPSSTAGLLHPSEMENYRMSHRMPFPCCLCPLADENQPDFVEAAIYAAADGPLAGKYIATCARDLCGYIGKPRPNFCLRGIPFGPMSFSIHSSPGAILQPVWLTY